MSIHAIRDPRRGLRICLAVAALAWAAAAWGAADMHLAGEETLGSGLAIGLGLLIGVLAPLAALNFWRGAQVFAALRRGEKQVARWTVGAAELAAFSAGEVARNAAGGEQRNLWTPPRDPPPAGLEVIVAEDSLLLGDTWFGFAGSGRLRIAGVGLLQGDPPAIAFRTVTQWVHEHRRQTAHGTLRIPLGAGAGAAAQAVIGHYARIAAGAAG
jgi:hypothetical protein